MRGTRRGDRAGVELDEELAELGVRSGPELLLELLLDVGDGGPDLVPECVAPVGQLDALGASVEPIHSEHADELWRLHQDEGVAAWHAGAWSHEDAARYAQSCEEAWSSQGVSKWIAHDRVDGRLVGRGGVSRAMVDGEVRLEVGWTLHERFWRRGFATEIGRAGLAFAFEELGADEVVAFTETNNVRSRAVMERLGMGDPREITHRDALFILHTINRAARPA